MVWWTYHVAQQKLARLFAISLVPKTAESYKKCIEWN
jgi:hypothetical protein